jgi:hypothetical protein
MPEEEEEKHEYKWTATTADLSQKPKKMVVSASQMEMMKRMSGGFK